MVGATIFGLPDEYPSGLKQIVRSGAISERSYGSIIQRRFTHQREAAPQQRFSRPATSSMEVGWQATDNVKILQGTTRWPMKMTNMSKYAECMKLPAGAPCSIGNAGGSDRNWRTNFINTLKP